METPAERHIIGLRQKLGDKDAEYELAQCYYSGIDTAVDKPQAFEIFTWAGAKIPHAKFLAGKMLFDGDGIGKDEFQAYTYLKSAAAAGDADAKTWMAAHPEPSRHIGEFPSALTFGDDEFREAGKRVEPVTPQLAAKLLEQLRKAGTDAKRLEKLRPQAGDMARAGAALMYGVGVPVNLKDAHDLLTTAYYLGAIEACEYAAWNDWATYPPANEHAQATSFMYYALDKAPNTAYAYYLQALIRTHREDQQTLRRRYLEVAAVAGHSQSLVDLAIMQLEGNGGPPDDKNGIMNLQTAAKGNRNAQYLLGLIYQRGGHGVTMDRAQATRFFQQAANAGQPDAMRELDKISSASAVSHPRGP